MRYGYARVSTVRQVDGNSLEDQKRKLLEAGAQEVVEESYTGTKMDRPAFSSLLGRLQAGDTLMVTKLDRFARTAAEGSQMVKELVERGVEVHILNMGKADNSAMGRLMVTILLAFAEYERDMIVERTQTGRAMAREKGIRVDGRPKKYTEKQLNHAMGLLEEYSYNHVADVTGISRSTLIREKHQRKMQTNSTSSGNNPHYLSNLYVDGNLVNNVE